MADERTLQAIENLEADSNYEEAYKVCTNALKNSQNDAELLQKTAMVAKLMGNREKCIEHLEQLLEIDPNNQLAYSELQDMYIDEDKFKYYTMRAKYKMTEQKYQAAIDDFLKAISNTDNNDLIIETRLLIAQIYNAMDKGDKAENQYLLILDMGPNTDASILLADYYAKNDDLDAAIATLNQAYEYDNQNILLKKLLGDLYLRVGNHQKAKEFVTDDYSNVKLLLQQEKNDEAKKILDNYSGAKNAQYYMLYAEYYYNVGKYDECFTAIDEFAKQSPKHPLIFQMRALCYEKQGNEAKAKYNWGWYNLMKGQNDVALQEFLDSHAIEKDINTIEQIIKLYDLDNDKTTANEFVEELVELEPKNTLALKRLGEFYQALGDYDRADEYYTRILDYDPNNMAVLPNAMKMAEKMGKETEVMEYCERIIKYAPDENTKQKAEKRMRVLKGEEDDSIISKFLEFIKKF